MKSRKNIVATLVQVRETLWEVLFLIIPNDIIEEGDGERSEKLSHTELFFKIEIGAAKFAF